MKTAQLLLNQVKGYLDRDMLTQNMFKPQLGPSSLNSVLDEVCGMLTPLAEVQGMKLKQKPLKNDLEVAVDKMRTQQILINLIQNSIKYSGNKGCIFISISSVEQPEPDSVGVIFSVRDQGKGIPKEDRQNLF